mmetsp:Transcript_40281/g.106695  ORF Transcript_40281/g.106695 Transcript_40281/m.106695 type:complete len:264 (+) Transcript_40281:384-1175(+)
MHKESVDSRRPAHACHEEAMASHRRSRGAMRQPVHVMRLRTPPRDSVIAPIRHGPIGIPPIHLHFLSRHSRVEFHVPEHGMAHFATAICVHRSISWPGSTSHLFRSRSSARRYRAQSSTSRIQPWRSSSSPSWIATSEFRSSFSTSNLPNSCFVVPFVIDPIGTQTVAVPHAPISLKFKISSQETSRACTSIPLSRAICISILFVIDGRIERDDGVTYAPSGEIPRKLDTENSSTYFCSLASRYSVVPKPAALAIFRGSRSAA